MAKSGKKETHKRGARLAGKPCKVRQITRCTICGRPKAVLKKYGNVSSACVYFVLQETLNDGVPGGLWWMSSFGAGFACHGALLEVE